MGRSKAILLLAVAMVSGLFAMITAAQHMKLNGSAAAGRGNSTPLAVAARDLPFGSKLTAADVEVMDWPGKAKFDGAFHKAEDLIDRVVKTSLVKGEPIFLGKLADADAKTTLAALIPKGMRAMTVRIDKSIEAGGLLAQGSRVDVVVTIEADQRSRGKVSKTILQNIEVLCVGLPSTGEGAAPAAPAYSNTSTVILLVKPTEAEVLAHACTAGKIQLIVRAFTDHKSEDTSGITAMKLVPKPDPAPAPVLAALPRPKKGVTAKDLFNMARGLRAQGLCDEAVVKCKELMKVHPESELCVDAQEQIDAIAGEQRLAARRQECERQLGQAREAMIDGAFQEGNRLCLFVLAEFEDLEFGNGDKAQDAIARLQQQLSDREKEAHRVYQLFRNYMQQTNMTRNAHAYLLKLRKNYPKSRFTEMAEAAFAELESQAPAKPGREALDTGRLGLTRPRATGSQARAPRPDNSRPIVALRVDD